MTAETQNLVAEKAAIPPFLKRAIVRTNRLDDVEFKAVETVEELKQAAQITYQEYLNCQYIRENPDRMKFSIFQTVPSSVTFIARRKDGVILGTVTIVEDSPLGLPSEKTYHGEFNALRLDDLKLAEVTMLSLNREILETPEHRLTPTERLALLMLLLKAMFDYLRSCTSVDEVVAAFHPNHESFYKFLQMEPLGDFKAHAGVKGSPAVARHLNIRKTQSSARNHPAYALFFGKDADPARFEKRLRLTEDDFCDLFVEHLNVLASADENQLVFIKQNHPEFDFDKMLKSKSLLDYLAESLDQKTYLSELRKNPVL